MKGQMTKIYNVIAHDEQGSRTVVRNVSWDEAISWCDKQTADTSPTYTICEVIPKFTQ